MVIPQHSGEPHPHPQNGVVNNLCIKGRASLKFLSQIDPISSFPSGTLSCGLLTASSPPPAPSLFPSTGIFSSSIFLFTFKYTQASSSQSSSFYSKTSSERHLPFIFFLHSFYLCHISCNLALSHHSMKMFSPKYSQPYSAKYNKYYFLLLLIFQPSLQVPPIPLKKKNDFLKVRL